MTEKTHTEESAIETKTTFISFLLDETGSMESIKDDTIGGFNEYVETLKKSDGDILFSLVTFNSSQTDRRYIAEPISKVERLDEKDYQPHAMTPLIDASVKIINATDEAVKKRGDDANVVVVIQTDGQENVSVEYDRRDLALLVKEKEADGWEFVFLGAGLDAFHAARAAGMNISADRVMSYERGLSKKVFAGTAANLSDFAADGVAASLDYSPEQRMEAGDRYHGRREAKARMVARMKKKSKRGKARSVTPPDASKSSDPTGSGGASTVEDFDL